MKRPVHSAFSAAIATAALAALASPAMAHGGAHLHPHGIDHLGLSLGLLAVALAVGMGLWGRK